MTPNATLHTASTAVILLTSSLTISGCQVTEKALEMPDEVSGVVVDDATGAPVNHAGVGVYINEKRVVSVLGPEGMSRPRIRSEQGTYTDETGHFAMDLRKVRVDLSARYPGEPLAIWVFLVHKDGYRTWSGDYVASGQTFRLKKKSAAVTAGTK